MNVDSLFIWFLLSSMFLRFQVASFLFWFLLSSMFLRFDLYIVYWTTKIRSKYLVVRLGARKNFPVIGRTPPIPFNVLSRTWFSVFGFYFGHTWVAYFDCVSVENFFEWAFFGNCLSTNYRNCLPILVFTVELKGEL